MPLFVFTVMPWFQFSFLEGLEVVNSGQYQVRCRELDERLAVSRRHLPVLRERLHKLIAHQFNDSAADENGALWAEIHFQWGIS